MNSALGLPVALVVDDEFHVREVCAELLRHLGFTVLTAGDGATGLNLFREHRGSIDVVMLDWKMPGATGDRVFAELRREAPMIPVVLATGYAEQEALASIGDDRHFVYLAKPFTLGELQAAVEQAARLREVAG